jgi:hypothetical protein
VKGTGRSWNVFLWLALFMGMGVLFCVYNMEWFARQNCPENYVSTCIFWSHISFPIYELGFKICFRLKRKSSKLSTIVIVVHIVLLY